MAMCLRPLKFYFYPLNLGFSGGYKCIFLTCLGCQLEFPRNFIHYGTESLLYL